MALCCIGGVCIPYSALLPLLVWGLRWIIEKLSSFGLLPKSLEAWLLTTLQLQPRRKKEKVDDCCNMSKTETVASLEADDGCVGVVASLQEWIQLLHSNEIVVAKFTASWCAPCKSIQPVFASLAAEHTNAIFVTIDADSVDEVANQYKVALLPTFLVMQNGQEVERYSGSDENKLKALIQRQVAGKAHS
ncbi:hypothetical protein MPSEU_000904100 [Mayamaea pseudoterrestris]|nr:hypothetical protein MPSEU_000904100 [Mayamaea pseudoterrestris]